MEGGQKMSMYGAASHWINFKSLGRLALVFLFTFGLAAPFALAQLPPVADLLVEKSGPAQASAGSNVTYTVTLTNIGPDAAAPVFLTDSIPAGMTFVSETIDPGFTCATPTPGNGGTINCSAGTLAASAVATFTFVLSIPPGASPGTYFVNQATATCVNLSLLRVGLAKGASVIPCVDPNEDNNTGTATTSTPPAPQPDMLVNKTGPAGAAPDTDVIYTVVVTNGGLGPASDATLNDTLPGTMTFVSLAQIGTPMVCTTPPVAAGGTVSCTAASFPAGGSTTLTLIGHIPAGTASGVTYINFAVVSTTSLDANSENNTSSTSLTVSDVDVSVTKSGPGTVAVGDAITYTLGVANVGTEAALLVQFSDSLPPNTTFTSLTQNTGPAASCSTPASGGTGTVTCDLGTLAGGSSAQFTLVLQVGNTASITNTVTATTASADKNSANNTASATTTVTQFADMSVTKSGPATVTAGTNITYTTVVSNSGPSSAASVSLSDTLPANTTFVSMSQSVGPVFSCTTPAVGAAGTITCTIATLASGASATFSIVLKLASSTPSGGGLTNVAVVSTTTIESNGENNSASTTATIQTSADASVTKSGPATVTAGANITYTVSVSNSGPSNAASVALADTLPANTTFVSMSQSVGPVFSCTTPAVGAAGTITCTIATLPPGTTATFSIVVRLASSAPSDGGVTNVATVATTTTESNSGNNSASTTATIQTSADVSVTKSGPTTVTAGTNIAYTVSVSNSGPSNAASVSLTDTLPANTTFVSLSQSVGPVFACTTPAVGAAGTITCTIATLAPGASATFSIVVRLASSAPSGGSVTNTASVSSSTADPIAAGVSTTIAKAAGNNTSSTTAAIQISADVGVVKSGPNQVAQGSTITYNVVVTNSGPSDAASVAVADTLPSNTTFVAASQIAGPAFTCTTPAVGATGTITCTIATLANGASATFNIVVGISSTTTGQITNTASVTAASPDPVAGNGSSTVTSSISAGIPTLTPLAFAILGLILAVVGLFTLRMRRR